VNSHFFNYQNWGFDNEEFVNKRKGLRYQASVIRLVTINMDENYVRLQNFLPQKNLEIELAKPNSHRFIEWVNSE
jgi:hypothetical protein